MTPDPINPAASTTQPDSEYRKIDLMPYAAAMWRRKGFIVICALLGTVLAGVLAYTIKPKYDSGVRFLPPIVSSQGVMGFIPTRNEGDRYLGLISSRTVADDVIEHEHLQDYFHTTRLSETRAQLGGITKFLVDKDQFVSVRVRTKEPETSLRIANAYLQALYRLNHSIALNEAANRLEYFSGPLEQEKNKLAAAEEDLKRAQQRTGIVAPEAQIKLGVDAIAQLRQELADKQVALAALRTSSTDQNPDVVQLRSQIGSLQSQVARLQADTKSGSGSTASTKELPELTLEVDRKAREVKFHSMLFEVLAKQYENDRVEQSYTPSIQLVEKAILPDVKSWPPRKLFMLAGFFIGGLLGLVWVQVRAGYGRWKRSAGSAVMASRWKEALLYDRATR